MYAVFATGGKQYRAAPGDKLKVEKLNADEGAQIELDQVLMVADGDQITLGDPLVKGVSVTARVLSQGRGEKIRVIKFQRRKQYRRQMGHRQAFTELEIVGVGEAKAVKVAKVEKPIAAQSPTVESKAPAKKKAVANKSTAKKAATKKAAAAAPAKKTAAKKTTVKKKAGVKKAGKAKD